MTVSSPETVVFYTLSIIIRFAIMKSSADTAAQPVEAALRPMAFTLSRG